MSWINKILPSGISRSEGEKRASVPEGVWAKCIKCAAVLYRPDLERNGNVCPKCDHHMRIGARRRLDLFLDPEDREEVFSEIEPIDRLKFRDKRKYVVRLAAAQKDTGERDALVAMRGRLHSMPVVCAAFEFKFHGGSMGQAVGEKFSRAAQLALKERIPLICFAASGGARMQEALISLMQMAKTSAVIERMHSEGIPYISVLTDPVYGGVSASLALLGDLNIAEPEARAGFAGPNIIEQTIRQKLPKGFQRSEFLLEHGAIDMIVPRGELRDTIARAIAKFCDLEAIAEVAEEEEQDEVSGQEGGQKGGEESNEKSGEESGDARSPESGQASAEESGEAPDPGAGATPTDVAAATAVADAAAAAEAADAAIEAAEAAADRASEAETVAGAPSAAAEADGAATPADTDDGGSTVDDAAEADGSVPPPAAGSGATAQAGAPEAGDDDSGTTGSADSASDDAADDASDDSSEDALDDGSDDTSDDEEGSGDGKQEGDKKADG